MENTTLSFEEVAAAPADRPAGSHWSTAPDMARYLLTELAFGVAPSGTRVVSENDLRTTWEPQVPVSADTAYGLGWFVSRYRGLRLVSHGGNTLGFTADLTFLPQKDLGAVVLSNGQGTNALNEAVREQLFELVFDRESRVAEQVSFGVEQLRAGVAEFERRLRELQPEAARPFTGRYRNDALGEVTLALEGGTLTLDAGEFTTELRPVVDDAGGLDGYIFFDAPLAREPTLVLGEGAVSYAFQRR